MAANELAEALQAQIWLACPPANTGEPPALAPAGVKIRAQSGFQARLITSEDLFNYPLIILPLEKVLLRTETAISVTTCVSTVSDFAGANEGKTYPAITTPDGGYNQPVPGVMPFHLDWMGPDLTNPVWYPFSNVAIDGGFDKDQYNAIAVFLTAEDDGEANFSAIPGDVIITIRKCPPPEGVTVVQAIIPPPG